MTRWTLSEYRAVASDVYSFLKRCRNKSEAMELVSKMEKRGEITAVHADVLRETTEKEGARAFRPSKRQNPYEYREQKEILI